MGYWKRLSIDADRPSTLFTRICLAILPSFLSQYVEPSEKTSETTIRPTAWLDGLRGWASLFVFWFHYNRPFHRWTAYGWGWHDENRHLLIFPIFRTIIAGPGMVSIFFVVSGYSISLGPLKELHNGAVSKCQARIASSIFRRPMRLFAPPLIISFMACLCVSLGFYTYGREHYPGWKGVGIDAFIPVHMDTFWEQLVHFFKDTQNFLHAISFDRNHNSEYYYNPPCWTIQLEFRWSLVVFLLIMGGSRLRLRPRLALFFSTGLYCWYYGAWDGATFIGGLLLAQFSILRKKKESKLPTAEENQELLSLVREGRNDATAEEESLTLPNWQEKPQPVEIDYMKWATPPLFLLALYLLDAPEEHQGDTPGYRWLWHFVASWWYDQSRFWAVHGAILLVYLVSISKPLQSFFSNSLSRYLGRISYCLYLVHVPIMYSMSIALVPNLWKITNGPRQGPVEDGSEPDPGRPYESTTMIGFELGVYLGWFMTTIVTVWIADIFTRFMDEPLVRLGKRLETWLAL